MNQSADAPGWARLWKTKKLQSEPPLRPHDENLETIARMERALDENMSFSHRLSDAVVCRVGDIRFVVAQIGFLIAWMILNSRLVNLSAPFDPFPFPLLALIVALESVVLTSFVLIKQNRMSVRAEHRNHLDLQINLLAEREATKTLQLLALISDHLGLRHDDKEIEILGEKTEIEQIAKDIAEKFSEAG